MNQLAVLRAQPGGGGGGLPWGLTDEEIAKQTAEHEARIAAAEGDSPMPEPPTPKTSAKPMPTKGKP